MENRPALHCLSINSDLLHILSASNLNNKLKFNFKNAKVTNIVGLAKKYSLINL